MYFCLYDSYRIEGKYSKKPTCVESKFATSPIHPTLKKLAKLNCMLYTALVKYATYDL